MEPQGSDFKKARREKANLVDPTKVDRLPPHSVEAEQGVLGCILLSPKDCLGHCIEKLPMGSHAFYDLKHATMYDVLLDMHQGGVSIDVITFQQELKDWLKLDEVGGLAYVASLPDTVPSAANLEFYLAILLEKFTLRKIVGWGTEVVGRAYDHQGEVDRLVDEMEVDVRVISDLRRGEDTLRKSKPLVGESIQWMEDAFNNQGKLQGIETGFIDLDKMTGGLKDTEFIIIAARPSTGKSTLCMNIADHVAVDLQIPVVVFSLEMSALSLMNRAICSRARVNLSRVRDGALDEGDFGKLTASAGQIAKAPLFIDESCGLTIIQLQSRARRYQQQYGVRLFVVDYLQLLRGGKRIESRQQEISDISQGLKSMAKELKVPVLVASQLNREVEKDKKKRKPRMSDIRESGAIENDADLIGLLHANESDEEDRESGAMDLIIAKQRNGPVGSISLTFLRGYTRFESAAKIEPESP